ncbi:hypothetical protein JTE90_025938 [Oedothorax gibbosus]|uniref:Uncharacterized protein n=1 Tax=Oedothorax gibbosus TaxID=931172 RepID=A0AAV6TM17_9ARAC|nr:hypothetical protein JTE90_025938 [Oedothorax gibbosus]
MKALPLSESFRIIRVESFSPSCSNVVSEPVVNWEGTPNTCFTVESLWGQPDAQSKSIPVTSKVFVLLTMRPEEYMTHREQAQARVLVHDPRALANPTRDGIILLPGKSYNIYVSQVSPVNSLS